MKEKCSEAHIFRRYSSQNNSEDCADLLSTFKLLGIDAPAVVGTMDEIGDLPIHLWIHDKNHNIIYGNSFFLENAASCMKQPCYTHLMGEKTVCRCCLAKECLTRNTIEKCTKCQRNNLGYDINVFHIPLTNAEGDTFMIKSSYHLDCHIEETGSLTNRFKATKKEAGDETLFLVMCSACNRKKDDNNNWVSSDTLPPDYPNVRISHGICPECIGILYPGLTKNHGN